MPIQASSKSTEHKKPRHPAGVFRMGSLGITPVVPYSPCAYLLLFFSGASCSLCLHHRKFPVCGIAAKGRVSCAPRRTKQPKFYPQKMWIILSIQALIKFKKSQNRLLFKQIYWQELSKLLIKKPTCFQAGFSTSSSIITITQVFDFYVFKICISYNAHYVK